MHECEKFQNLILEYADGSISKADEARLTEHLEACAHCRKELEFTKNMLQSLQEIPSVPLPEHFHAQLHQKLESVTVAPKKNLLHHLPKYSFAVSAVAAFAIMVIAYNSSWKPTEQQSGELPQLSTTSPVVETQPDMTNNVQNTLPTGDNNVSFNEQHFHPQQTSAPVKNYGKASQTSQTTKPKSTAMPSSENQKNASALQDQAPASGGGSSGGGGGGSSQSARAESGGSTQNKAPGIMFVVHSTISQRNLDLLYGLPTCREVDANYFQLSRSYQNKLIELLKECEYSIHFASEASRVDDSAIIIELI